MKKCTLIIVVLVCLFACKNESELSKSFDCSVISLEKTKEQFDFKKNFKLSIPSSWKTNLYYDKNQSELFTADTTKQLTTTYILDVAFNFGSVDFDNKFYENIDSIIKNQNQKKIKSGNIIFKLKPAYWYVVKGEKKGFMYHQFNLTVVNSINTYFTAYSEIYGDVNIEERICASISILDGIEFLQ